MSRITPATLFIALFAILFGLVGAYAVKRHLTPAAAPPQRTFQVPLASIDLSPDKPIRMGDIVLVQLTSAQMHDRNLPPDVMANTQQIIGRYLREPMTKGEAFVSAKMYPEGMGPSVADRLQPGKRAVTIGIKGTGALAGFASPGAKVDVLFRNHSDEKLQLAEATVTLVENAEILAFGQNAVPDSRNAEEQGTVTLAVSAVQANALKVVEGRGDFSLSLRSPEDDTLAASHDALTMQSLLNLPTRQTLTTEIYRGGARQTLTFQGGLLVKESFDSPPVVHRREPARRAVATAVSTTQPADDLLADEQ